MDHYIFDLLTSSRVLEKRVERESGSGRARELKWLDEKADLPS